MKPIVVIAEAYGEQEEKLKVPFVGNTGAELLRMMIEAELIEATSRDHEDIHAYWSMGDPHLLNRVWKNHPEIYRTNVFNLHPPGNKLELLCGPRAEGIPGYPALLKSLYVRQEYSGELDRLADELLRADPNLIIALGNTPLWALAGKAGGITKIRGYTFSSTHTVEGFKVLPTYHPSYILRGKWEERPTVIADFMKAKRQAEFPEIRRPPREIWIEPGLGDIREFIERYVKGCDILSVDIETYGSRITCVGFAPGTGAAIVIPFDDERTANGSYWKTSADEKACWRIIGSVLGDRGIKKLFQNGAYDIAFLLRAQGIRTYGAEEDSMLLSHALQPEALKGLGYLGSIFSDEGEWKHLRKKHETIKRDD